MEYVESQKVSVEFRMDSVLSQFQSDQQGHPVYVEKPFITVVIPGSGNTIIDTVADEMYQKRFPEQWARFKAGQETDAITGWRLESWPQVNTAQVKTLKYMGVHTVEQLADLSDSACQSLGMGTMELRVKAKAALNAARSGADTERLAAESSRMAEEMAAMRAELADLRAAKEEAPRRGRPPKTQE